MLKERRSGWGGKAVLWLSLFCNFGVIVVLVTPVTSWFISPLMCLDEPQPAEVIVILSAGGYASGVPDQQTMLRLWRGMELYHQGYAPAIICTGGVLTNQGGRTLALIMKESLMSFGVPEQDIFVQDSTQNTYYDISAVVKEYAGDFNFENAIFVSSAYHTLRINLILQKKGLGDALVVGADPWQLYPHLWIERAGIFRDVCREYGAIIYFWLRGWL